MVRKDCITMIQSFLMPVYIEERNSTMKVLDRLKMELSNHEYFSDEQQEYFISVITQKY